MSHAWWHIWGGNKSNSGTTADADPKKNIGYGKGQYHPDTGMLNTGIAIMDDEAFYSGAGNMFLKDQNELSLQIKEDAALQTGGLDQGSSTSIDMETLYKNNRVLTVGNGVDNIAIDPYEFEDEFKSDSQIANLYGERFDGTLETMNQRGYRHRQKKAPAEEPFMIGDWETNKLNDLDNPTYHLTLYIDNKQHVNREMHERQGVIIAETGSTTYFHIDNLEISTPCGGSHAVTNIAPELTWTITEPNGAAFFPKLMEICEKKGIPTVAEAGYALELRFKGRDKITGQPKTSNQKWVYKLSVTDVQTKHGIDGSTYNFRAVHLSDTAAKASWNNPNETITVTQCSTLGEAMKGLEEQLNKYHNRHALKSSSKPDTVKITLIDRGWASWKLKPPTGSSTNTNKPEKSDWTLDAGSSVKDFITKLILHTQEMEDRLDEAGVDIKIDTRDRVDHIKEFYIKYFKVKTTVKIGSLWNDSMKKFNEDCEYIIFPFNEPPPEKQARFEQIAESIKLQRQKLAKIKELDIMTKRYDYVHTGLNTEVIQFDATLDMAFFQPEVAYGGKTSYNVKAKKADIPEDPSDIDPSSESAILAKLQEDIDRALKIRTKYGNLEQELIGEQSNPMRQDPVLQGQIAKKIKDARKNVEKADKQLNALSNIKAQRLRFAYEDALGVTEQGDTTYLGDINVGGDQNVTRKYLPTYAKRTTQVDNGALMETAKQNLENTSGDMLNIEIGIKGDPYWLGAPATGTGWEKQERPDGRTFKIVERGLVDYDIGPPVFLFSMFFPDPLHGNKPYFNKLYSGVYKAMTVIHQFRGGQFTQFLTGVRDTAITEPNVIMLVNALKPSMVGKGDIAKPTDDGNDEGLNGIASDGANVAPAGEVPATVSGREQQVMDRLINHHGLTPAQAAGVVGNLNKESALKTGARNPGDGNDGSDSIGIAQWNSTRADNLKAFAASKNVSHLDLNTQADFIMHELNGSGAYGGGSESGAWNRLKNASNEQSAAEAFTYYERFKDYNVAGNHETISRKSQASRILNNYYSNQNTQPELS
tara:strand:+ start:2528 stop:5653 length:3126 start_codon:yes stop_codon:yes gene_type:complete